MSVEDHNQDNGSLRTADEFPYDVTNLPTFLPLYYKLLFPYGPYYTWLSCGGDEKSKMANREFSFTLHNDVYVRYQSFTSQQEMEKEIQKMNPHKIDIGAIYSRPPRDHNKYHGGSFKAIEKELVFDIDMTDYDEVRNCCQGAAICMKCWPLMTMAIKLINRSLQDDFGFKHCLWVYSGRRGVHCWVCDEKARRLTNHGRAAIAEYLSIIQGGKQEKRVNLKDPVHPFLRHSITIISKYHWDSYSEVQDMFADVGKVLQMIPEPETRDHIEKEFENDDGTTQSRWQKMKKIIGDYYQADMKKYRKLKYTTQEIMLEYCYPRLDAAVTTGVNHLLKSPFCIHPKTGRICVPIDINQVDDFNPTMVPTISRLCQELDSRKTSTNLPGNEETDNTSMPRKMHIYKQTSLAGYVKIFEEFVQNLQRSRRKDATIEF